MWVSVLCVVQWLWTRPLTPKANIPDHDQSEFGRRMEINWKKTQLDCDRSRSVYMWNTSLYIILCNDNHFCFVSTGSPVVLSTSSDSVCVLCYLCVRSPEAQHQSNSHCSGWKKRRKKKRKITPKKQTAEETYRCGRLECARVRPTQISRWR